MSKGVLVEGKVIKSLPGAQFVISITKDHTAIAYISGKIRVREAKIIVGDKVLVELSLYDLSRGRILRRIK